MGNLQSELRTTDYSPNQLRNIYNNKKNVKTGGQYVYLIIKNIAFNQQNKPFPNSPDDQQIHLQTFIVDSPGKIFQIAYNSDPNLFDKFVKSMTRYEMPNDSWSKWSANQADGTNANYAGNVSVDGGDFSIINSNKKMDAKFCIGTTCLSQSTLNDILISSNSSMSLLSSVDTPFSKKDGTGACNWGYGGTISYSNDGKGLSGCVKCTPGTYKFDVENSSCKPCSAGTFCEKEGTTNRTTFPAPLNTSEKVCEAGTYCPIGSSKQTICPSGVYCGSGSPTGIFCPTGTYNSLEKQTSINNCLDCGPGYYCPSTGSSQMTDCPKGYYCPDLKNYVTKACPAGTYNGLTRRTLLSDCSKCPTGTYCPTTAMGSATPCSAGKNCQIGSTTMSDCRAGYYCPTGYETECPAGSFCPTAGLSGLPGTATGPKQCPAGTSSVKGATIACSPCNHLEGKFQNLVGAIKCETPDPGYYATSSTTAKECEAGYYCSNGIRTICPPGSYCPARSPTPTTCSPYTSTPVSGGIRQQDCNPVDIYGLYGTQNAQPYFADKGVSVKRNYDGTQYAANTPMDFSPAVARNNGQEIGPSNNRRRIYLDWDINGLSYLSPNESTGNTTAEEFYERRCRNVPDCSGIIKSGSTLYAVDNRGNSGYLPYNFRDSTNSAGYTYSRYKYHSQNSNALIITKVP